MSYVVQVVDMKGKKVNDFTLSKDFFGNDIINEWLIHEYIVMYLANQRQSTAHTKTRWEITRSWRKLYRQKGSGRARVGDAGSPVRRKGGVVFGPRSERNRSKDMPTKMKNKALCGALSLKAKAKALLGLKTYTPSVPKTKDMTALLQVLDLDKGKILLVLPGINEVVEKSCNNIPWVDCTTALKLNAYDVMSTKNILFVADAYDILEKRLTK